MMKTFLHVGCGQKRKNQTTSGFNTPDWKELRLDIDARVEPDYIGTMTDMASVPSESVDAVFSSHNIEHVYPHEVSIVLKEFLRVLKPDGFVVITCPDLKSVSALIAQDKLTDPAYHSPSGPIAPIDIVYGHRPALAAGNEYMAHKCGFTKKVLLATLENAGFNRVASKERPMNFDLWALATKINMKDENLLSLAKLHFPS